MQSDLRNIGSPAIAAELPEHARKVRHPDYYDTSVAIIGISCHFPGAQDHRQFWDNLISGREGVEVLSAEELRRLGVSEEIIGNPGYVPVRSTIAGKDLFDPAFFNISPEDATLHGPAAAPSAAACLVGD